MPDISFSTIRDWCGFSMLLLDRRSSKRSGPPLSSIRVLCPATWYGLATWVKHLTSFSKGHSLLHTVESVKSVQHGFAFSIHDRTLSRPIVTWFVARPDILVDKLQCLGSCITGTESKGFQVVSCPRFRAPGQVRASSVRRWRLIDTRMISASFRPFPSLGLVKLEHRGFAGFPIIGVWKL